VSQSLNSASFNPLVNLKFDIDRDGFAILPNCLDQDTVERLRADLPETRGPDRKILALSSVRALASSRSVREIVEKILGPECFTVRGIFFDKTRQSNWKVVWHQDVTIAVREQRPANGFGTWTTKGGIWHVQPPPQIMEGMLAIRLHLDESDRDNGPLRVLAGTHRNCRLSAVEIAAFAKNDCVTCTVPEGGALLMRPLLLHASSACVVNKPRRVIHLEFAAEELSHGLHWYHAIVRKSTR
jgi:ectoine hydroxylase-related dioxygenase (phytanoyl-CoA dioxygenase family)